MTTNPLTGQEIPDRQTGDGDYINDKYRGFPTSWDRPKYPTLRDAIEDLRGSMTDADRHRLFVALWLDLADVSKEEVLHEAMADQSRFEVIGATSSLLVGDTLDFGDRYLRWIKDYCWKVYIKPELEAA